MRSQAVSVAESEQFSTLAFPEFEDILRNSPQKKLYAFSDINGLRSHSTFCRITGVPPLQSDFFGLSSALKDNTIEPKKRKETRSKPTKMAREKVNATDNTYYN